MSCVLIIDDDIEIHTQVKIALAGFQLEFAKTVSDAKTILATSSIDLVILDVSLPDGDGMAFFMEIQSQEKFKDLPVMFLTSRTQSSDKVAGLSLGADDYVTKPFDRMELKARVSLRIEKKRRQIMQNQKFLKGSLKFDILTQRASVLAHGQEIPIELTSFEFKLLLFLAKHEDQILSRRHLLDSVWGSDINVIDRTVDAHVSNLRKKLKDSNYTIRSVYGEGYQFTEAIQSETKTSA